LVLISIVAFTRKHLIGALESGDRDRSLEDADAVIVPGLFSFGADTVYVSCWGGENGPDIFAGAVLCWGEAGAV